jgi:hypothetical protein
MLTDRELAVRMDKLNSVMSVLNHELCVLVADAGVEWAGAEDENRRLCAENEVLRDSNAAKADRIDRLGETVERLIAAIKSPQRHKWWGAGEPGCPADLKAPNGELHTLRCKLCGAGSSTSFCLPAIDALRNKGQQASL